MVGRNVFNPTKEILMTKLLSTLIVATAAMIGFSAQAASHAGAAPMKASDAASAPATKASGAMKKETKKEAKKEMKSDAK
jgi:hypothetical protein